VARLTAGQVEDIRRARDAGLTYQQIAQRFGVPVATVGYTCRRRVKTRTKPATGDRDFDVRSRVCTDALAVLPGLVPDMPPAARVFELMVFSIVATTGSSREPAGCT